MTATLPKPTYYLASNGRLMQTDGDVDCTGKRLAIYTEEQMREYGAAVLRRLQAEKTESDERTLRLESALAKLVSQRDELLAALHAGPSSFHTFPGGEACMCSQCQFVRLRNAAIARTTK